MRKLAVVLGIVVVLTVILLVTTVNVKTISEEGFVGPDFLWESKSFFAVYDLQDGHLLANVSIDANTVCPRLTGLCTDVEDLTYFGYRPLLGDHVRVQEYFFWLPWEEQSEIAAVFSLTFVEKLPKVSHVVAVPLEVRIHVNVNGQEVGTFDDLGEVIDNVVVPAIVTATP